MVAKTGLALKICSVFEKITQKSLQYRLGCAASVNIWKDAIAYDELTINERQKQDDEFSSMLDCVRCGRPTDETLSILQKRVIQGSIADKFVELQQSQQSPVCLFPRRKECDHFNNEMLSRLSSQVHKLLCTDEVDETYSTRKWSKKAAEQLDKLNKDCNLTAGLEAQLLLAVGARVMLRRNIDTNAGLVNGAIGTVLSIRSDHVSVQFDHISEPYDVEKVKSRFMVMKNFYVYRKQFPLILAYAVTIHKCQGLSLDCAIVDLSDKVFSAGMAYVAISRVRTLAGVHLVAFDPNSIMVSTSCLKEVNRLRQVYRPDLKPYPLLVKPTTGTKRKLTGNAACTEPESKKHAFLGKESTRENSHAVQSWRPRSPNRVLLPARALRMSVMALSSIVVVSTALPLMPLIDHSQMISGRDKRFVFCHSIVKCLWSTKFHLQTVCVHCNATKYHHTYV